MSPQRTATQAIPAERGLLDEIVRVPGHVVHRRFPSETVVLNLETGMYHGLNHTGGRMLEALEELGRVRDVAAKLAAEFEQPVAAIEADLCSFCASLLERRLVTLASSTP